MNDKYEIIENFLSLCAIPHKSHHEEAVSLFLRDWAEGKGLKVCRDGVGNVIIEKPASPGQEGAPLTILQAHMDMVTVWEDGKVFDPLKDPIVTVDDGKTLRALGTSLGADDGIGVAMAMTILEDPSAVHGPLRAIFTVNEEDGMTGADALEARHLQGQFLINLDWEVYGFLCCSSAGGTILRFHRSPRWESAWEDPVTYSITVKGLTGGHSGYSIHYRRANAIRTLAGMLSAVMGFGVPVQLSEFQGGSAPNAIPSAASAVVTLPRGDEACFLAVLDAEWKYRRSACRETDPGAELLLCPAETPEQVVCTEDTGAYLNIMSTVPDGVRTLSSALPGLVGSSANTGTASLTKESMEFVLYARSMESADMEEMVSDYLRKGEELGFSPEVLSSMPAWPVRTGSFLVELCRRHFRSMEGRELRVEPIHAGLECGCLSEKNPALDIISIGPEIADIHSPRETLVLDTVYRCDELVRRMLKDISELC